MIRQSLSRVLHAIGLRRRPDSSRSYDGAAGGRLVSQWITAPLSADAAIRGHLRPLRDRCRDLERNNEWARGFFRVLENNVLGEKGFALQMKVEDRPGKLDEPANQMIENAWLRWGKPGNCSVNRRHGWRDIQRLTLRAMARDGEVLIHRRITASGLRLQVIEADYLDENLSRPQGQNEIRMGIEYDPDRGPVAYWLLNYHPGDAEFTARRANSMYRRVPASEIIHLYLDERIDQSRGVPWLVASLKPLRMLAGYQEAELVAARTASAKMGFFTKETPEGMTGEEDAKGNLTMDATPGVIEELPPGVKFQSWDPSHPGNNYSGFVKGALRGVASSLGVSYNTLASDLEGVNYSSIRAGLLEEREVWKAVQRFLVENMAEPIFTEWLWVELLSGRIPLPPEKFDKFNAPEFRPRRWSWVDPKKDMEAHILAIGAGLTSRRAAIAEGGGDVWDTFADIAADSALAAQFKIALADLRGGNSGSVDKPDDPEDDE